MPLTYPAVRATAKALDVLITTAAQGGFNLALRSAPHIVVHADDLQTALDKTITLAELDIVLMEING